MFVAVKPEDFDMFDVGKADGFILWPIFPSSPEKNMGRTMEAYVNGFISGVRDRVSAKNLPHVFLHQSARQVVGDFHGNWFPVISQTVDKFYVLVSIYTEVRAFWVDKSHCTPQDIEVKF